MSTVGKSRDLSLPTEPEDYRYGYREVPRTDARGRIIDYVRMPLTEEDVLHPQEGDVIMNNSDHQRDCRYLVNTCIGQLGHDPHSVVLSDTGIFWDDPSLRHHAPDVAVILGVRPNWRGGMFYVAVEGVRPALIIEITSPSTRNTDFRRKRRQYYLARVPIYVIVDEREDNGERVLAIIGYRRGPTRYQRQPLNEHARLWLEVVQVWLGAEDGRVACYDTQGHRIPDVTEVRQANEELVEANAAAQEKIRELEAELRRLREEK
jgi:Uma2 family endonuclease